MSDVLSLQMLDPAEALSLCLSWISCNSSASCNSNVSGVQPKPIQTTVAV